MKTLKFALFMLLALAAVPASAAPFTVQIVQAGLYATEKTASTTGSSGITINRLSKVRLIAATTDVPAKIGSSFGFKYKLVGTAGDNVVLSEVVVFPPPGANPPGRSLLASDTMTVRSHIGEVRFFNYELEDAWEVVPGVWKLEVRQDGKLLASQAFTVK